MLAISHSDLERSTALGTIAASVHRLNNTIGLFTNKLGRAIIWILASPIVLLIVVAIWIGLKRFVSKMPKALRFEGGNLAFDDKDDYAFHMKNRKALRKNDKVYTTLEKEKWFKIVSRIPVLSDLFKIVKISSDYCTAVDAKLTDLETSSFTSTLFTHRSASSLRRERTGAYEYAL